jgi:hypothetical protein
MLFTDHREKRRNIMANTQWKKWAKDYYGQLVGYTIKEFKIEDDSEIDEGFDSQFPVFILTKGNASGEPEIKISVSQDEEGNGSGFLFIEDNK